MYNIPVLAALRDHLSRGSGLRSGTLRDKVYAAVDHLKAAGCPPPRVVLAITRIAEDAGLRPSPNVFAQDSRLSEADVILVRIVQWVLDPDPPVDEAGSTSRLELRSAMLDSFERLPHDGIPVSAVHRYKGPTLAE